MGVKFTALPANTDPIGDTDLIPGVIGGVTKKNAWSLVKSTLATYFNTLFAALEPAVVSKTANYTITTDDHTVLCDATSGNITITLPAATSSQREFCIVKTDNTSNTVVVDGNSSETINGATTITLSSQYDAITITTDGTSWYITQ